MIEIENINNHPSVVFYDNDPKYVAKVFKDDKTVYITHKRKDYGNKFQYGIIVNDQEIYGTATYSLGSAITWAETYLCVLEDRNVVNLVDDCLEKIERETSLLKRIFHG